MKRTRRRGGFTLVELVIVGLLAGLFGAAIFGERVTMNETSRRIKCASNLRQIGLACLLYANENKGSFPRTRHDPAVEKWPAYSKYNATDPFTDDGPEVNDLTAPLYLLMRTQDIVSQVFICPSTDDEYFQFEGKDALAFSNFPSRKNLSYSYCNPYGKDETMMLTSSLGSEFVVAGDMNPGGKDLFKVTVEAPAAELKAINSKNHKGDGQNVLYGDGHVSFESTPFAGVNRDNIYAPGEGDTLVTAPANGNDSILLPTDQQDAPEKEKL